MKNKKIQIASMSALFAASCMIGELGSARDLDCAALQRQQQISTGQAMDQAISACLQIDKESHDPFHELTQMNNWEEFVENLSTSAKITASDQMYLQQAPEQKQEFLVALAREDKRIQLALSTTALSEIQKQLVANVANK